jgi:hypothetical protein
VIRQAISCDICGTEKRQTNHWFVAYEQASELRVSGWASRQRRRAGSKHLCGQKCLHKLIDDFIANSIASRSKPAGDEKSAEPEPADTTASAPQEFESARLAAPAQSMPAQAVSRAEPELIAMPSRLNAENGAPISDDPPRHASRAWRSEAWQRERERELRDLENHPAIAALRQPSG